jgi:3-phosphoshikimate 1-carboxyvinyltransferase
MGVQVGIEAATRSGGEEVGDLLVSHAPELVATAIRGEEIPSLIDEVPLLAVLAAFARGRTVFEGIGELRHKESDRVEEVVRLLRAWSVTAEVEGDALCVEGTVPSPSTDTYEVGDDHRLAMAAAVLALGSAARGAGAPCPELDLGAAAISDPDFVRTWEELQGGD